MPRVRHVVHAAALLACLAGSAVAQQAFISEMLINPPSPTPDQGRESIEIMGTPGLSLSGWKLIQIEGDLGTGAGTVDYILDLSAMSIGSNGLLLIRDDPAVLNPAPSAGTNVVVMDFNPDIENGSATYILGFGTFTTAVGTDLDTDNDGTFDNLTPFAGFTAVDVVSFVDGDTGGVEYADDLGGTTLGDLGTYTADALYRIINASGQPVRWAGGDVLDHFSTLVDNYFDANENFGFAESGIVIPPNPQFAVALDLGVRNRSPIAPACYANCDGSTITPILNVNDFVCFNNLFAAGDSAANCDGSTTTPILNVNDFVCFLNAFATGCS
ncbi:MAG: GC-type dockerin domain-anchored protein [Phycisphaerales bacterium]